MTHEVLVNIAATTHAAVLIGALAAYYKFGDRTDVTAKSLQGTEQTLRELRRLLASELADSLKTELGPGTTVTTLILDPNTTSYVERPADVFAGERYREVVRQFIESNSGRVVECRALCVLRDSWAQRARRLSWCLLVLVAYQAVVAGALAFLDRTGVIQLPDVWVRWAAAPTAALILLVGTHFVLLQLAHDDISHIRMKYAEL